MTVTDGTGGGAGAAGPGAVGPARTGLGALFRNWDYPRFWLLGALTGFIRWLQLLVLGVYSFEITGSPFLVSLIPVLWLLPLSLSGPVVGAISDRLNRKVLLTLGTGGIMVVSGVMWWFAETGALVYGHIAIASVLSGLYWATDMPLRRRMMGDAAGDNLQAAMGFDAATNSATRMLGPFIGGVTLEIFGIGDVFLMSGLVYALCILLVTTASLAAQPRRAVTPPLLRDLADGIHYALGNWQVRRVLAVTVVFNIFGFPFTAMIPILGSDILNLTPSLVGLLSSLEGGGAFAGGMAIALWAGSAWFGRIYVGGGLMHLSLVLYLGLLAAVAGGPHHSFAAVSLALLGIGLAAAGFAAMQSTLTYLHTAPEFRSRVLGVLTLCIGTGPLGFLNVGWMAEAYGVPTALVVMALEGMLAMTLLWLAGVLRRPAEPDPPASPPRAG